MNPSLPQLEIQVDTQFQLFDKVIILLYEMPSKLTFEYIHLDFEKLLCFHTKHFLILYEDFSLHILKLVHRNARQIRLLHTHQYLIIMSCKSDLQEDHSQHII